MILPQNYRSNICYAHENGCHVLPNGTCFSLDSFKTKLNDNVLVIGGSGGGKTRGNVEPNILSLTGSYVITDPKGCLYRKYSSYMKRHGYNVIHLDFIHPERSDGYNPFHGVHTITDIMKLSHALVYAGKNPDRLSDPFWDSSAVVLLSAIIGYLIESKAPAMCLTISMISQLVAMIDADAIEQRKKCALDIKFESFCSRYMKEHGQEPWSFRQYEKVKKNPPKTLNCILTTLNGNLVDLDTPEINTMMKRSSIDFTVLGKEKTVVFVEVSDTDRSRDMLVNTFYTQAINSLCTYADEECADSRLPVPVRFILDDFGTNCRIEGFENMISNIRSRNISAMIILQSVAQLKKGYEASAHTIIENCDTFIYMGGNDLDTAQMILRRANKPLNRILEMPVCTNWVFRRGQKPVFSRTVDIDEYTELPEESKYADFEIDDPFEEFEELCSYED